MNFIIPWMLLSIKTKKKEHEFSFRRLWEFNLVVVLDFAEEFSNNLFSI